MNRRKPELREFGITPEEYAIYTGEGSVSDSSGVGWAFMIALGYSVGFLVAFVIFRDLGEALMLGLCGAFLIPWLLIAFGVNTVFESRIIRLKRGRLFKSPVASRIRLYDEAVHSYKKAESARQEAERAQLEAERIRRESESMRRRKLYEHWTSLSGEEFERELGTLYRQLGYRVESTPSSGDHGIDLILISNGKTTIVQCKSYKFEVDPVSWTELWRS